MKLIREPYVLTKEGVKKVEELKNAKWLLDTEHKGVPVSVFWQEVPHPEGSNFFALYYSNGGLGPLMITDGAFILDQEIQGLMLPNGDVIYSRHRHDYFQRGDVAIDGGREYTCVVGNTNHKHVSITVDQGGNISVWQRDEDGFQVEVT